MQKFKLFFLLFCSIAFSLFSLAQTPEYSWAKMMGNPSMASLNSIVCALPDGNVIMGTDFEESANFGSGSITSNGATDIAIVKYDSDGEFLNLLHIGGTSDNQIRHIKNNEFGQIYVCGIFYGTIEIGTYSFTSVGSQDIFLTKVDTNGDILWATTIGGIKTDECAALSISNNGNIILGGDFYGEITIGDSTLINENGQNIWVASFSDEGEYNKCISIGGTSSDYLSSISCNSFDEIIIAAAWFGNFTFGDTTITTPYQTGLSYGTMNSELTPQWMKTIDGTNLAYPISLNIGEDNNILLSGNFNDTLTFGDSTYTIEAFNQDSYIAKLDSDGNAIWSRHIGSISSDGLITSTTDGYGSIIAAGEYQEEMNFGDGFTLEYTLCCGIPEIYFVKYHSSGEVMWAKRLTGTYPRISSISMPNPHELYTTGCLNQEMFFDEITLISEEYKNYLAKMEWEDQTNIDENNHVFSETLTVAPNPSDGNISINTPSEWENATISVYSIDGRKIYFSQQNSNSQIKLQLDNVGTYLVVAQNKEQKLHKIIVVK